MSIVDFKTEFSVLLNRYAILPSPTEESSEDTTTTSPNHRELLNAIQDTIRQVLNVKLQYLEEAALKTPANNEIVVATPDAPDVLRMDYINQTNRYEAEKRCTEIKLPNYNGLHTHREERVEVLDNEIHTDNANNNNNKNVKNANLSTTTSMQKESSAAADFHQKFNIGLIVEETQQNVQKVMSNLQRMADILAPETRPEPHAVRRLSSIILNNQSAKKPSTLNQSHHHHHHHTSLRISTIQRAKAARRSLAAVNDDVVTTPTTSRPSLAPPPPPSTTSSTMKNKSNNASAVTAISKLAQHSVSMSSFDKPKSPVKPPRNPKYAHVQSTIPKANVAAKKKTTTTTT